MIVICPKKEANIHTNDLLELLEKVGVTHLRLVGDAHLTRLYFGTIIIERMVDEVGVLKVLKALPIISSAKKLSMKDFQKLPYRMQTSYEERKERDRH